MDKQYVGKFQKRLNNEGSTLITVIVAIAFVTILVTIILGTTVVNVRMKGIDRRTHDDFYYAEKSLNDIYTGLGQEFVQIDRQVLIWARDSPAEGHSFPLQQ